MISGALPEEEPEHEDLKCDFDRRSFLKALASVSCTDKVPPAPISISVSPEKGEAVLGSGALAEF
jgi:hypothetical protein